MLLAVVRQGNCGCSISPVHVGGFHKVISLIQQSAALSVDFQCFAGCLNAFGNEGGT